MKSSTLFLLAAAESSLSLVSAGPTVRRDDTGAGSSLWVTEAPQSLRPYALPKYGGTSVRLGNQIYRFSVTGNSSGGAFTLLQTNAPASGSLGVLPHIHKEHYENFYCTKGRVQLWTQSNSTSSDAATQATRVLTQGDYGAVPHDTIHTFQMLDPDTHLTGVIQPGGFERLFLAIGDASYPSPIGSPFIPADINQTSGGDASVISALQAFDVWAQLDFSPRQDAVNGMAGGGDDAAWHNGGNNTLAPDAQTPFYVAKNYGPKYLHTGDQGVYSIVAPLVREAQSAGNFSMGTISMSPLLSNMTSPAAVTLGEHTAFQVEEGKLVVQVDGFAEPASLIQGDVVFLPANTSFVYYAAVPFTKFLYVTGGSGGIDEELIQNSVDWGFASYPQY